MNWSKVIDALRAQPLVVPAFLIGIAIGVLVRLPLIPYRLDGAAAEILGSALGAAVAVWSAVWITGQPARHQAETLAALVREDLEKTLMLGEGFVALLESLIDKEGRAVEIARLVGKFSDAVHTSRARIFARRETFIGIGPSGVSAHRDVIALLDRIEELIDELLNHATSDRTASIRRNQVDLMHSVVRALRHRSGSIGKLR